MSLPKQSAPVERMRSAQKSRQGGVAPSDSCGCPNVCIGPCVFGRCVGVCM